MTSHKHPTKDSTDLATTAASALATLKDLDSTLPLDDALPARELVAAKIANRVPNEAMSIVSTVLNDDPTHYPQFDAAEAKAALEYEQTMSPVGDAVRALADRIDKSVLKRRSALANTTLALYVVLKGNARLPANEKTRTQVKRLSTLLTTKRKSRATSVTQVETEQAQKEIRAQKVIKVAQAAADAATGKASIATASAALVAARGGAALPPAAPPVTTSPAAPASPAPGTSAGPTNGTSNH
jgi:hypothetical protein